MTYQDKEEMWSFFRKPVNLIKYGIPALLFLITSVKIIVLVTEMKDDVVNSIHRSDERIDKHEERINRLETTVYKMPKPYQDQTTTTTTTKTR